MQHRQTFSIVVPANNEAESLPHLAEALHLVMEHLSQQYPDLFYIRLFRNFGHQKANAIRSQMAQEEMQQKYLHQLSYENRPLETDIPVWNQKGEKMVLQQLITNQERLILYYSTFGCTPCNNEQIALLKEIAKEFGQERILMLVAGADDNTLRNLKRIDKFSDQVLLRTDGTGLPSEQGSKPLLFLLGPDQEINMIYAADIDTPESNQLYRNRILSRFRKQAQ